MDKRTDPVCMRCAVDVLFNYELGVWEHTSKKDALQRGCDTKGPLGVYWPWAGTYPTVVHPSTPYPEGQR